MKGMGSTAPKIIVEFSLTAQSKKQLQRFMDEHIDALSSSRPRERAGAMRALQEAVRETFPPEALAEYKKILAGDSEYALLVHNCPERKDLQNLKTKPANDATYSEHIGNALYAMSGARHVRSEMLTRTTHIDTEPVRHDGVGSLHRDSLLESGDDKNPGQFITFSSPYNGEHAVTELIHLRRAVLDLPPAERKEVKVMVSTRIGGSFAGLFDDRGTPPSSLEELLKELKKPTTSPGFVMGVNLASDPKTNPSAAAFMQAFERRSALVDLQPGDLLVVNENQMFHRAHHGDQAKIEAIPPAQTYSRILLHNAGTPQPRR